MNSDPNSSDVLSNKTEQPITNFLDGPQGILKKVKMLTSLTLHIQTFLPRHLAHLCQVVNYQQNILTLQIANASCATSLRFQTPQLLAQLRTEGKMPALVSIQYLVRAPDKMVEEQRPPYIRKLSKQASAALQKAAGEVKDDNLAKALRNLSNYGTEP